MISSTECHTSVRAIPTLLMLAVAKVALQSCYWRGSCLASCSASTLHVMLLPHARMNGGRGLTLFVFSPLVIVFDVHHILQLRC